MRKIDFNFYDGDDSHWLPNIKRKKVNATSNPVNNQHVITLSNVDPKAISIRKTEKMIGAIEVVDGKVPKDDDIEKYGMLEHAPNGHELVYWRGKPLMWFGPTVEDEKTKRVSFTYKIL